MADYTRPNSLADALALRRAGGRAVLAGGTDHFPARVRPGPEEAILDISAVPELKGIRTEGGHVRIGGGATWTEVLDAPLPPLFDGLKLAAREVGGRQIQNLGTIAGNLCNASPAADGVPALLALDAKVRLASVDGERVLPLADFMTGYRRTALRPDELLTAVEVPLPAGDGRSHFLKLGARHYLVISIAMVAATLMRGSDGRLADARIAVGACSAVAQRLPDLESKLHGRPLDGALAQVPSPADLAHLAPIDDARASADYRRDAALSLVRRALAATAAAFEAEAAA